MPRRSPNAIEREINFSPGGSDLPSGPIPEKGSFVGETERMPSRSPNAIEREINCREPLDEDLESFDLFDLFDNSQLYQ